MGQGGARRDDAPAVEQSIEISLEEALALGWLRRDRGHARRRSLFVRGSCGAEATARLAIVGSRAPTGEQAALAGALAEAAVQVGWAVWSGGADGVDTIAHRATLHAGGHTVAVLPAGMTPATPAKNAALFDRIGDLGGLLAAAVDGAAVQPAAFRARNVTLAAAVDALLVVCASDRSGSLHAAGRARAIGLPVATVPWSPRSPNAAGGHALLEGGARCVASPEALLRWLAALRSAGLVDSAPSPAAVGGEPAQRSLLPQGPLAGREARTRSAPLAKQDAAARVGAIDAGAGGWQRYAADPAALPALSNPVQLTAQQRTLLQAVVGSHPHGLSPAAVAPVEARGAMVSLLLELALEGLVVMDRYGRHLATPAGLRAAEKDIE